MWQVRQPLYDSSVGRWRQYEAHLGPLLKALARSGRYGGDQAGEAALLPVPVSATLPLRPAPQQVRDRIAQVGPVQRVEMEFIDTIGL